MATLELDTDYRVTDGPCRGDLIDALKGGSSVGYDQRPVYFTIETGDRVQVLVSGLDREDGSGESWIVQGYSGVFSVKVGYRSGSPRRGLLRFSR